MEASQENVMETILESAHGSSTHLQKSLNFSMNLVEKDHDRNAHRSPYLAECPPFLRYGTVAARRSCELSQRKVIDRAEFAVSRHSCVALHVTWRVQSRSLSGRHVSTGFLDPVLGAMMKQVCWHSRRSKAYRGLPEARMAGATVEETAFEDVNMWQAPPPS